MLVANAGLPGSGQLTSFSVEEIDRALAVNLRAPMVLARLLAERMVRAARGHLVFMSSLAGKVGHAGLVGLQRDEVRPARLRAWACARTCAPAASASASIFPGFVRDAGMFHDTGAKLPGYVGTVAPEDVADAVVRAIERNRGEIDVAPLALRAGAAFAALAPAAAAAVSRRIGSGRIAEQFADGQRDKR